MKNCFAGRKRRRRFAGFAGRVCESSKRIGLILVITGAAFAQVQDTSNHSETDPDTILAHELLDAHNAVRIKLNLPLLKWSNDLAASSRKWADALAAQDRFYINPNTPYGQNLFMASGGTASPAAVVWHWASESRSYDHDSNTCSGICGHYTQLVWKNTSKVGCAVARRKDKEVWVCDYDPPGNVSGQTPY